MTVQGTPMDLSLAGSVAAVDTGTTLVGGPADVIAELYSSIPDSSPGTGNLTGYYTYRESHPATQAALESSLTFW